MALPLGLPSLPAGAAALFITPVLAVADTVAAIVGFGAPQWGIFDQSGNAVITFDAALSFEFGQDWKISDYQIEGGSFTTYNKVQTPAEVRFVLAQGGSVSERADFLNTMAEISDSYDLYSVVIPEITYLNYSIQADRFRRSADDGATLIKMLVSLRQIRETATSTFSQTAQPAAADQVNGGSVQPVATTPAQQSALSDLLGN